MKQFFETGSPLLNMLNGFSNSLKLIPAEELSDDASRERVKAEGLAILKSAQAEAKRRKALALSKAQQALDGENQVDRPRS